MLVVVSPCSAVPHGAPDRVHFVEVVVASAALPGLVPVGVAVAPFADVAAPPAGVVAAVLHVPGEYV